MKQNNVTVTGVESTADYDGLEVKFTARRLRAGRMYTEDVPSPDDVPDDVVLGLYLWLQSTRNGRKLQAVALEQDATPTMDLPR